MGGRTKPHVEVSCVEDGVAPCGCLALACSKHVLTGREIHKQVAGECHVFTSALAYQTFRLLMKSTEKIRLHKVSRSNARLVLHETH